MIFRRTPGAARWLCAGLFGAFPCSLPALDAVLEPGQPPPAPGEIRIPLSPLPTAVGIGLYQVTIREPDEPEEGRLGGSGGPLLILMVAGPEIVEPKAMQVQAVWLYAKDRGSRPPEFSLWSKTGVSSPVRCALEWHEPNYCVTECQDYEVGGEGLSPVGSPRTQPPCDRQEVELMPDCWSGPWDVARDPLDADVKPQVG